MPLKLPICLSLVALAAACGSRDSSDVRNTAAPGAQAASHQVGPERRMTGFIQAWAGKVEFFQECTTSAPARCVEGKGPPCAFEAAGAARAAIDAAMAKDSHKHAAFEVDLFGQMFDKGEYNHPGPNSCGVRASRILSIREVQTEWQVELPPELKAKGSAKQ